MMNDFLVFFVPLAVGLLIWLTAGVEAGLFWFLALHLLRTLRSVFSGRPRRPLTTLYLDHAVKSVRYLDKQPVKDTSS